MRRHNPRLNPIVGDVVIYRDGGERKEVHVRRIEDDLIYYTMDGGEEKVTTLTVWRMLAKSWSAI